MSNIDKRALREAAEKAISEEGETWWSEEQLASDYGLALHKADAKFIAAANPATVLALLDEIAELEQRHCGTALLEREEMHTKTLGRMLDELDAKDRRISELEAREVKLPNPHAHLIWIQAGHAPDDYWDDVAVSHSEKDKCCDGSDRYPVYALWEIKEALSAIGINIAAAGKGEDS
ncbi:TPA: ead/Ea22-like family protein [Enterobacter cloacae]|uniref:ead/Ea22-like family protein n=1 Tax=Escherichia coli TaxID=562 RepID=UPI001F4EB1FD|nr:ead/Ea22-like family protein [Escherichia coli]HEB0918025.1 ead/Ea22-like family protein [Enterobacter cloacae]MCH9308632.1 ead/Ea22-like family protein [Escherichia coli]HEB0923062.1 ead/Ea22-like family protein [Enterobacter cloacae]HEB0928917.1 ead/Ea22-like family protein [Enterobacter cloacae]HEB0938071.1 ead/Ea22-like family protein [Enterobacter cloacae]